MKIAKVFKSGNSQAVRLPKDFQFDTDKVEILKRGDEVIMRKIPRKLTKAYKLLTQLPKDFFQDGRQDTPPQKRDSF